MSKADKLGVPDYLDHIIQAIERIDRYTDDMDELALLSDERTQDAVLFNFETCRSWSKGSWDSKISSAG